MRLTPASLVFLTMMGIIAPGHTRGHFEGTPKNAPGPTGSWMNHIDKLPIVGQEKGDRAEIERISIPAINLNIGAPTIINRELPVGDPWLAMRMNFRGELLGGAAPAGAIVADSPLPLFSVSMTTDVDRDVIEPTVSARALYRYQHFMSGTAGEIVAATVPGAAATTVFNAVVTVPFVDERLLVPFDSVLDTRRYANVTLTINTGVLGDIVTGAADITLQNTRVDIELVRVSPRVQMKTDIANALPFYKRHAPIVPPGGATVDLDRVPSFAIKRILHFFTTGSTAGTPFTGTGSNAILDTGRVSSNFRDHFGSPMGGVSRRTWQGGDKENYSIETWPAGWYVSDFCLDGSAFSALSTGDKSILQALYTYQAGLPATPQGSIFIAGLQKLRGTEGM